MKLIFTFLLLSVNLTFTYSQISPYEICLTEGSAFVGLDRKNWTGDLSQLSESYQFDFQVPNDLPEPCSKISTIEFVVTDFSDSDNTPSGCFTGNYSNLVNCNGNGPASCDAEMDSPGVTGFTLFNFADDYQPGQLFGFDIVAVINVNDPACSQTAISDGTYSASIEVCMIVNYESSGPMIDLGGDLDACANGTIEIEGPEDFIAYEWEGPVESFEQFHPNATVGYYVLTVTDSDGCTGTDDINVFQFDPFIVEFTNPDPLVICGGSTELDVLIDGTDDYNGYMFTWTDPDGDEFTDFDIAPDIAGNYNLAVFDLFTSCIVEADIMVEITQVSPAQIDSLSVPVASICDGQTLDLEAFIPYTDQANYSFQWTDGVNNISTNQNLPVTEPGMYVLNLLNDQNCPITSDTITISQSPLLSAGDDNTQAVCSEEIIPLTNLIASNADANGRWIDLSNTGSLTITEFNTNGLSGTYGLQYIVDNPPPCINDTAVITLVVNEAYDLTERRELCDSDFIIVNGVRYDGNNPNGAEILRTVAGCDSTITIDLSFMPEFNTREDDELCDTDFIIVNGNTYDINNPTGMEMLSSVINGCDSIVTIDLTFTPEFNTTENDELCDTGFIIVNGNTYDINNPTGTEMLSSINGCDSIVTIDLSFIPEFNTTEDDELCDTDFIIVNGNTYDINNPTGTEMLSSINGCDSIVTIDLSFIPEFNSTEDDELCDTDFIIVNGNTYDINNPTGTEMLSSINGCDSIVIIDLSFIPEFNSTEDDELCDTDFIIVNGNTYDINNPTGTEMLSSINGCDSIVTIDLSFVVIDNGLENPTPCSGEMIMINGEDITIDGMYLDTIQAVNGCDSIVEYNVIFQDCNLQLEVENIVDVTCFGDTDGSITFDVNGDPGFPLTYLLEPNLGTDFTGSVVDNNAIVITDLPSGAYTLTVSNAMGSSSQPIVIEDPDEIIVDILIDNEILCNGDMTGTLQANITSGNSANLNYLWSNMETTASISNLSAGSYSVTVSDSNACSDDSNIILSEPDAINFSITTTDATCEELGAVQLEMIEGGKEPYMYNISNFTSVIQPNFVDIPAGNYTYNVIDDNGCRSTQDFVISEISDIIISPIGPYEIQEGESVLLDLIVDFTPVMIEWQPSNTLDCTDCLTPTAQPLETTVYTVTITDSMGCTAMTEVTVIVNEVEIPDPEVYIPNIFNPSIGGGENSIFKPLSSSDVELIVDDISVFDRWGNVVYQESGNVIGWNGTRNDTDAEAGVYLYRLEYQVDGRSEVVVGELTLVR